MLSFLNNATFVDLLLIVTSFFVGRYNGQRKSEKINDLTRSVCVGMCDKILHSNYLTWDQKEKLSEDMIESMPSTEKTHIRKLLKSLGI